MPITGGDPNFANFVNGFPLFAASIGVLHQGRPLVGAVWCSTSHALRAGVYHARAGGARWPTGRPMATCSACSR